MMKPIGIMGGTFDPIHFGHLRTALEIQNALNLTEVKLIPCFQPVHRGKPFASPFARLKMAKLATLNEPALSVDTCEIERASPSWTIDTIELLREQLPASSPLCLIMGVDVFSSLPEWNRHQDLLKLAHLIIAHRPQHKLPENIKISRLINEHQTHSIKELHNTLAGHILFHPVTQLEISATNIRKQFANKLNPRFLLPDLVCDYINQHKIYQNNGTNK